MDKKLSGIVEELANYVPMRDRDLFVESRAQQVIASVAHLVRLIEETYDAETANDLSRRLHNAIRSGDDAKFCRKVRQIRESRQCRKKAP